MIAQQSNVCEVCGTPVTSKRKYCKNGHKITSYRRRVQQGAKPVKTAFKASKSHAPVKSPAAAKNAKKAASPFTESDWTRKPTRAVAVLWRWGDCYEGTLLRKRWTQQGKNAKALAPVYVGVDTLSLPERQARAFAMADLHKLCAVVVDGVLYPKPDDGWHVWRSSDELLDYVLREKKLPPEEMDVRVAIRQLEHARNTLLLVFAWDAPEDWAEALKFHTQMLATAKKNAGKAQIARLERRVQALGAALSAQRKVAVAQASLSVK